MEHLNPRGARVVALEKPTESEKSQWYFQRYVTHLPTAGEMVLFDRSWYNRAGVETVMGFCTPEQYAEFMRQAPAFEEMLVNEGIHLTKFWFSVSPAEQRTGSRSGASTRFGTGSSLTWTWNRYVGRTTTRRRRRKCFATRIPTTPRGSL
jgi:polyphosphate kinase 2 (PPK2 family)